VKTYLIGYDLNRPRGADDYPELHKAIKALGAWWHHLDSTWIVKTDRTAAQTRDLLKPHIDSSDELLVVRLSGEGAWVGFNERGSSWLKNNLSYE
jgi:hypothetical protein